MPFFAQIINLGAILLEDRDQTLTYTPMQWHQLIHFGELLYQMSV
jgi:hypothetical protein